MTDPAACSETVTNEAAESVWLAREAYSDAGEPSRQAVVEAVASLNSSPNGKTRTVLPTDTSVSAALAESFDDRGRERPRHTHRDG